MKIKTLIIFYLSYTLFTLYCISFQDFIDHLCMFLISWRMKFHKI